MPDWDTLRLPRTVVADETARLALTGQTEDDVGRVYRQTDDSTYWMLVSIGPNTWRQVLGTELVITEAQFSDPGADPSHSAGVVYWRADNLNLMTAVSGVVRQLGEEVQLSCHNDTGAQIANGTAVRISGALGNKLLVEPADKATVATAHVVGMATHNIADGADGYVTTFGVVRDLNTNAWPEGTELYLGSSGALTADRPTGFDQPVFVGWVVYQHPTDGEVQCAPIPPHILTFPTGITEARPLTPSASFANLEVWSWTDEKFPAITGQTNQTDWTVEAYRDTQQLKAFFRYDQDNQLHGDVQMPHEWAGTAVEFHLHTIPMAAGSGDVYWSGSYCFTNLDDELPAASGWTAMAHTQTLGVGDQYVRQLVEIAPSIAAPVDASASAILSFRLARLGSSSPLDTYETDKDHGTAKANLCIESYDVHYQRMLTGSFEEASGRPVVNPCQFGFTQTYGGVTFNEGHVYVQLAARSTDGNEVEFQVWDVGEGAQKGSAVSTSSTTYVILVVGPFDLEPGFRDLRIRGRYTGAADMPVCGGIRLIMK